MKKLKKDVFDFAKTGISIGALGLVPGEGGVGATGAVSAISGKLPIMGKAMMAGHIMRLTKKFIPKKKKGGDW